jgi:hypothetical protein
LVRQIVASLAVFALLIAPSIGDLLASRADACKVAPCCIGKMSKSCPMHPHPSYTGTGMRSCGNDEQVAVAHHAVAILTIQLGEDLTLEHRHVHRNPETSSYRDTTPPDPPPPRTS